MLTVLNKLFTGNKNQAFEEIIKKYEKERHCTINFLYFANMVEAKLLKQNHKENKYKKVLLESDFLFPDGIALQMAYFFAKLKSRLKKSAPKIENDYKNINWLPNLNGTDFVPYFLDTIVHKFGTQKICIILYGSYPQIVEKTANILSYKGYNVVYRQDGYSDFDWKSAEESLKEYSDTINILLVAQGTPKQEIWIDENKEKIKSNNMIVFGVGGLFDHITGEQKRAPKFIRFLKLERLRRFILYPKRNFVKVKNTLIGLKQFVGYLLLKKN